MIQSLLLWAALAWAEEPGLGPPLDPPRDAAATAEMTHELASKLRCPVCQGLSVNDSKAEAAVAMKARIEELVAQGYGEEQIVDYFIDRYGEWVLLEPQREGLNWLVWVGPPIFLAVGGGLLAAALKRRKEAPASPAPAAVEAEQDPYVQKILDELKGSG